MRLAQRRGLARALRLAAALLVTEVAAVAEPGGTNEPAPSPTVPGFVLVVVPGAAQPPASLEERVLSWFSADTVKVSGRRQQQLDPASVLAGPEEPGVKVWLLPRTTTTVRLFFSVKDPAGAPIRYLVTDFALPRGFDELGLEQLSQVIYLSATALWEGRLESSRREVELGLSVATAPATAPSAVPKRPVILEPEARRPASARPVPRRGRDGLSPLAGLEYSARLRGHEGVAQGPGGFFSLSLGHGVLAFGGRMRAALLLPTSVGRRQIELELRGYSFSLGPWLARRVAERLWLDAELGVGADVIRFDASAARGSGWTTGAPVWEPRPLLVGRIGAQAPLGGFRIGVTVGVALQLLKTRYDVTEPSGHSVLLTPWRLQPATAVELSW